MELCLTRDIGSSILPSPTKRESASLLGTDFSAGRVALRLEKPPINQEEIDKQVGEKLKEKLLENKQKADLARKQRREDNLNDIVKFVQEKGQVDNQQARDLLQVSQSTATTYLTELSKTGRLKIEKKAKATIYKP